MKSLIYIKISSLLNNSLLYFKIRFVAFYKSFFLGFLTITYAYNIIKSHKFYGSVILNYNVFKPHRGIKYLGLP